MVRVLVATVGGRPEPVVNAVRENAPLDHVIFLCSGGAPAGSSSRSIRCSTLQQARRRCPHCGRDFVDRVRVAPLAKTAQIADDRFSVERVDDPDDLDEVFAACERIEGDVGRRWPRCTPEVIANYTCGTKTMSLGLVLFALRRAGRGWKLQLNRPAPGGRTDLIAVRTGDHAVLQDASAELAEAAEGWAKVLAGGHEDAAAVLVLSRVLAGQRLATEQQARLLARSRRSRMWAARDRGDYPEALELARQDAELGKFHGCGCSCCRGSSARSPMTARGRIRRSPAWSWSTSCARLLSDRRWRGGSPRRWVA